MKMIQQGLIPGVEHGEESDFAFQVGSSEIGKSLGNGFEEDVEQNFLIDEYQRVQFVGQGEDQMDSGDKCCPQHLLAYVLPAVMWRSVMAQRLEAHAVDFETT